MDNQNNINLPGVPSYPVNMTDHDLLIRVDQKVTQLSLDVAKGNDTAASRLAVLESKVVGYDTTLAEYPPAKLVEQLTINTKWINDFKLTWRIVLAVTAGMGSLITFIGMIILNALGIIKLINK